MCLRFRSVALLATACTRLLQYSRRHTTTTKRAGHIHPCQEQDAQMSFLNHSTSTALPKEEQRVNDTSLGEYTATAINTLTYSTASDIHTESEYVSDGEIEKDNNHWLQREKDLDENELHRRQYQENTLKLKNRVWDLWCQ